MASIVAAAQLTKENAIEKEFLMKWIDVMDFPIRRKGPGKYEGKESADVALSFFSVYDIGSVRS